MPCTPPGTRAMIMLMMMGQRQSGVMVCRIGRRLSVTHNIQSLEQAQGNHAYAGHQQCSKDLRDQSKSAKNGVRCKCFCKHTRVSIRGEDMEGRAAL